MQDLLKQDMFWKVNVSCKGAQIILSTETMFFSQSLQEYEQQLSLEKKKQGSLIGQLKDQLEEMERCVAMVW